jgi:hypothetical protein
VGGRTQAHDLRAEFNSAVVAVMRNVVQCDMNRHGGLLRARACRNPRKTYARAAVIALSRKTGQYSTKRRQRRAMVAGLQYVAHMMGTVVNLPSQAPLSLA